MSKPVRSWFGRSIFKRSYDIRWWKPMESPSRPGEDQSRARHRWTDWNGPSREEIAKNRTQWQAYLLRYPPEYIYERQHLNLSSFLSQLLDRQSMIVSRKSGYKTFVLTPTKLELVSLILESLIFTMVAALPVYSKS